MDLKDNRIRIVWIPNQLSKDGRIEKFFDYQNGRSLEDYLKESGFDYIAEGFCLLSSRTGRVKVLNDYVPENGEEILVMRELKDPFSIAFAISMAIG